MQKISTGGTTAGLLAALQTAAADYFDTIELDGDNNSFVDCYVGETLFLRVGDTANSGIYITTSSGATVNLSGVNYPIWEIYKCESGILLSYHSTGNNLGYYGFFAIGRDADGNTAVVTCDSFSSTIGYPSTTTTRTVYAASVDDSAITTSSAVITKKDELTGKTAFSPIYTQSSYIEGIWVPMLFQFSASPVNPIPITADGRAYLQCPFFILEDGAQA